MNQPRPQDSLQTLREIRGIMERSGRFLSLSGWSGVWAGLTAVAAAAIANRWIEEAGLGYFATGQLRRMATEEYAGTAADRELTLRFVLLALATLAVAVAGGLLFTLRKAKKEGLPVWNSASKQMIVQGALPLAVGGAFAASFLYYGQDIFIAPTCLAFYGLALVSASRHTLGEIRYLGYMEIVLAVISLIIPGRGLLLWAIGFGALHIFYGILMWNKYERRA